ncbi:hypothetical protein M3Y97_00081600 [Aphelenchoides bicaudatus]|nr:hypothetical protein M3Y97_00081600 [Aphelenchoides bicaudatus]
MIALFGLMSLAFYLSNALPLPLLTGNSDQKLTNGQSAFKEFNLFELPIVSKRPALKDAPIASNHQVKADLAVVSSAEIDTTGPFNGYGEAVESPTSADMFVINTPSGAQESKDSINNQPIGVVPKLTGHIVSPQRQFPMDKSGAAIVNPTAYFLEGANLDKVQKPKCRLLACGGPIVDDDIAIEVEASEDDKGETCQQVFMPIVDAQIRIGMSCRVCCDAADLLKELKKTRLQLNNGNN